MIEIYNSLSQSKQKFIPVKPQEVSIYYCGMTVYDYCHIGHARSWVFFDAFAKFMQNQGFQVTRVRNITDIDDKIIARANEHGETAAAWAGKFIEAMHEDEAALGLDRVDHEPKATEYLQEMIDLITVLEQKGIAYQAENGDVCFAIDKYPDYGELSNRNIETLRAGVRKVSDDAKRDPLDFVLWKTTKPGEPSWPSPWGEGRPGWHIECSAMAGKVLGTPFDIHGGGMDLKFPHHENEIAQSQAACEHKFANYWMHVGLVQVGSEKMSKSLGNFITIRELVKQYDAEVLRFFLLSSHYRSPLTFTDEQVKHAEQGLRKLYQVLKDIPVQPLVLDNCAPEIKVYLDNFNKALADDFNTPEAYAVLFELARLANRMRDAGNLDQATQYASALAYCGQMISFLNQAPESFLAQDESHLDMHTIDDLVAKRNQARADKDWALADALRDQLSELGVICEDTADGRGWRLKD